MKSNRMNRIWRRPTLWFAAVLVLAGCGAPVLESTAPAAQVATPAASPAQPSALASSSASAIADPTSAAWPSALPSPSATSPAASPSAEASPSAAASAVDSDASATAFSGQRAMETVRLLAETIGSRPAGSDAERRAADALAAELQALGWAAELQTFPIRSFQDRGSSLRVAGLDQPVELLALQNSAPGTVSGRLVPAGLGRSEDLAGVDLTGAIALLERGEITFGDKVRNVAAAGAAGAVIYNQADEDYRGMLQDPSTIPAAGLNGITGRRLAEQARQGDVQAELVVDASIEETSSANVVATLPGASDETVVLGAHYDSVAEGPGANDNASGTATVLELARVLAAEQSGPTFTIVLFGAEEIGLVGSRYYVDSLNMQQRERIGGMLNFDMVGVGDQAMVGGTDELVQLVQQAADEQGIQVGELGSSLDGRSDHAPFLDAGVPTLFFHRQDDPRYHTADDRAEYVEVAGIEVAGRLALAVLDAVVATP